MFNPFKRKISVTFILKSGRLVHVKCDEINIQKSGNDIVAYNISGMPSGEDVIRYIRLDDISAIVARR